MRRAVDVQYASDILAAGATALEQRAAASANVVCGNLPLLKGPGEEDLALVFCWPGWLMELGPCGEIVAETHASQLKTRPRARAHLALQTRGASLLRVPLELPGRGIGEAVFKATGRVLIRDNCGRLLARSLPGQPAVLDPLFWPLPAPGVDHLEKGAAGADA